MAINSKTTQYDDLASTTLEKLRTNVTDAIFEESPFWRWMMEGDRMGTTSGGTEIQTRVMYAKNKTVAPYAHYDRLSTAPTESITAARYGWRQYAGNVTISGREEAINSGPEQLIPLLGYQVDLLTMSFKDQLAEDLLAPSADKDLSRQIMGLEELVEPAAGGSQSALGGIDRAANPWWRNQHQTLDYAAAVSGGDTKPLYTALTTLRNDCQRQKFKADDYMCLGTQRFIERFERENRDDVRYTADRNGIDLGWENFRFKGIRMAYDERVYENANGEDDHRVFMLNRNFLKLEVHKNRNFAMTKFKEPVDQDAKVAHMLFMGQLVSSNNRHNGVLVIDNLAA